ncbi:MAG TPA: PCYCGC motif-containing (lipo)protein [Anaerolineales bacterium]|nr:PCYCGC motif-containing (lipo)protein [Anaerolineales bacterium]
MKISRTLFFSLMIGLVMLTVLPACSTQSSSGDIHLNMASMELMPAEVHAAPVTVQEAYQFNVANPEIMKDIPCYCGCGNIGHTSNYDCYISDVDDAGNITFDNHALGCSICVDITQDVMRMLKDGKSPQEARASIDATYSKYGPSNIP